MSGVGRDYITCARQYSTNGSYSKAVDLYFLAFEKNPQLKTLFEVEFRAALLKYNEILAQANRIEDILSNFGKALNSFPENIYLINEIGRYLFKFGYYEEAWNQFQKALTTDASYVSAEKNLNSVKNLMVERWHFRMLNDKIRNENYRAAIREKVIPRKSKVLDLGTGTGLLAMYAAEGKPMAITACDSSDVMTTLTDCILQENGLAMSIMVINKMSTSMNSSDIKGKCSLLITELFDAGLFGEHVLQSLNHAWENLLADDADVIPKKAEFFIMGANSELLCAKYQMRHKSKSLLNIQHLNIHIVTNEETYDCDDVTQYEDLIYLTEPQSVVKVDFTNKNDIQDKLNNTEPYVVELKALKDGQINTFIGWFNLYLTDNICITTDPRNKKRANAWQQAIFYDSVPRDVQENDTFNLEFFIKSEKLTMKLDDSIEILRVSTETLRFFNDYQYINLIKDCIGMCCIYLGQLVEFSEVNIMDLSPFPLFGYLMLRRGIKSLVCYAKNDYDREFLETVFAVNRADLQNVTVLIGDIWSLGTLGDEKFHIVFVNLLELCGDLDLRFREIGQYLKNTHLVHGGLFMPYAIKLMAQIVSSDWLDNQNRVYDQNLGYKVSNHINKFQVSQNFNLNYNHLEYTPLTDPVALGNCHLMSSEVFNIPIINDGEANAILCWYEIELIENIKEISTKTPFSFVDGITFLANPIIPMVKGHVANIIRCVDSDGCFKLIIDAENT